MNLIKKTVLSSYILSTYYLHAMTGNHLEIKPQKSRYEERSFYDPLLNRPKEPTITDAIKSSETKSTTPTEIQNNSYDFNKIPKNKIFPEKQTKNNVEIKLPEKKSTTQQQNYLDNFSAKKMQAPLEQYVEKIRTEVEKIYPIAKTLPQDFMNFYTMAYIQDASKSIWISKIDLNQINKDSIPQSRDWDNPNPSNLEKISAGVDALQKSFDTKISSLAEYHPDFKDFSMSDPMEYYIQELQKYPLFANESPVILQHYIFEVLKETRSGEKHWLFGPYDTLTPSQVATYKPQWPKEINSQGYLVQAPTPAAKIYAMFEAMDTIKKTTSEKNTIQQSQGISFFPDVSHWVSNILTPAEKTALKNIFTQEEIEQIEKQSKEEKKAYENPELIKNYLETKNGIIPYEKTEKLIKESLNNLNRLTRRPLALYFIDTFQETAKNIGQSKDKLKTFISSIIQTFGTIKGLSKQQIATLEQEGNTEVENLAKDKSSWFYAKTVEFNEKFNLWIEKFLTKLYEKIGKKNPQDIESINFIEEQYNPLTPKIDINWNTNKNKVASIIITYKDNTLLFTEKNFIFDDATETYYLESYLYPKPQKKNILESINYLVSDTLTNAVAISPLQTAAKGNPKLTNEVNKLEKNLISQPYNSEGILALTYDPAKNSLETVIIKQNTQNAQISSTIKIYTANTQKLKSQTTKISPKTDNLTNRFFFGSSDTYTPDITVNYDPNFPEKPVTFTVTYEHPQTKKIFTYTSTPQDITLKDGTYTAQAFLKPAEENSIPAGITGQIISLWENFFLNVTTKTYKAAVSGFKDSWTGARLKQQYPQAYDTAEKWMLANYQTGIDSVIIEFNPTENIIATRVLNTTAEGKIEGKNAIYLIN